MASQPKNKSGKTEEGQYYIRIIAPAGPRRRAGFSFGKEPVDLTLEQLGDNPEARKKVEKSLVDDPMLSVAFYEPKSAT